MIIIFSQFLSKFFFIILGLLGLSFLIAIHELGHFVFCKLFKVYTPSFSIGFGPIIVSKKIGETNFKLSAIPLGGYVEIGQAEEEKIPYKSNSFYFETINWWKKLLIMLGGIIFNFLSSYFILIVLSIQQEHSIIYKNYALCNIESVAKESEAFHKNLNPTFCLLQINELNLDETKPLAEQLEKITISDTYQKAIFINKAQESIELFFEIPQLKEASPEKKAMLFLEKLTNFGITFDTQKPTLQSAINNGIKQTNKFIWRTFLGLKAALTGTTNASLSGPIMIIAMSSKIIEKSINQFLIFLALISINLALINLIPLPILDGGQIFFLAIELILQKPLNAKIREYISLVCWIGFMVLFAYLSLKDLFKLII